MKPTLHSSDILITNKIAQRFNRFKRNDIVIAIHPHQPKSLICKRLIASGGDIVLMNSSTDDSNSDNQTIFIKPGYCWLEGDNRVNSTDSRNYGQIPMGLIKSKVLARIWPPSEFKVF
jgi:mitochondrial inner membrane protease subunit 1